MNLQESIKRILREVRVPRNERVELYKDDNIIVVVPLTHRALQKYAHQCQWCINDDKSEWEDYHKGRHAVIIQRNPKKPKIGITNNPIPTEIFFIAKWDNNQSSFEDICQILEYEFRSDRTMGVYYNDISNDINNFATNIVYYSPETGIYDQEDNFLWNFNFEISDIPNVTPEVIKIMDDYLQESEEINIQETIRKVLKEETDFLLKVRRRLPELDSLLPQIIKDTYKPETICRSYRNSQELFEHISHSIITDMYYTYFDEDVDDLSEEWGKMYYLMFEYLHNKHGAAVDQYYHINCGD